MDRIFEFFALQLRIRPALVVFFLVFLAACIPLLYYYKRRNPNPRFRPTNGEMTLVSVFAAGACYALALALSSAFDHEHQLRNMQNRPMDEDAAYSDIKGGGKGRNKNDKNANGPGQMRPGGPREAPAEDAGAGGFGK